MWRKRRKKQERKEREEERQTSGKVNKGRDRGREAPPSLMILTEEG